MSITSHVVFQDETLLYKYVETIYFPSQWNHFKGLMLKLKLQDFGHLMRRADSFEKTLMLGRIGGQEEKGTTEDEMAGWHHRLDGHEFG